MTRENKIINSGIASTEGIVYQFYIALWQCFQLETGQKLWIEKFGDITISGEAQLETKHYTDPLTDSHPNFWKTLKNWLHPTFNHSHYKKLILITNQSFGSKSTLINWNSADEKTRLKILEDILLDSEKRHTNIEGSKSPSQNLINQRTILNKQQDKLKEIIPKIYISIEYPEMDEIYKRISDVHARLILQAKKNDFFEGLIGYLITPSKISNSWEITYEGFNEKIISLTEAYKKNTQVFPSKFLIGEASADQIQQNSTKRFIKKIYQINHLDAVSDAITHYLIASLTVLEEFKNFEVDMSSYNIYKNNLKEIHKTQHRKAKRNLLGDPMIASQNFYDDLTGENPLPFPVFRDTPIAFRNGIFHILADDKLGNFEWRLWD
ncbi:hypothetical protein [Aquirhabdus parva]|uniref:DUF4297 domain-containing protein n=1 Tax=Aquirhabdus parva TaxID=2283318 RepID=A0A345P8U0_9GAMM|nr:hypothetical protein [Aquirhabdus parva]AXI03699.1 hypothetical protein HYN46_13180 [Aquirhabdus parva]